MKHILLSLLFFVSLSAFAQHSVVVNPDGTHTIAINHGHTTTIVNPDGTHTTAINHGHTTTIVNQKDYRIWQVLKSIVQKRSSKKHDRKK